MNIIEAIKSVLCTTAKLAGALIALTIVSIVCIVIALIG